MNIQDSQTSLSEFAYQRIRTEVLSGRARPGSRLKINDVCAQLSINLSAVREALSRLCADGLVIAMPQRGFRVAPVSASELRDLTAARIDIERLCLRRAVLNPDIGWETALIAAGHQLFRTGKGEPDRTGPSEAWRTAHIDFHRALVAGCNSPWLLRLHDQLYMQAARYLGLSLLAGGVSRKVDSEHRGLMEAMLARDAEKACDRIAAHFQKTTKLVIASGIADET